MKEKQQDSYPEYPPKGLVDDENGVNNQPEVYPQNNQYMNSQKGLVDDENEVNQQPAVYPMNSQNIDYNQNKDNNSEDILLTYGIRKGFIIKTYGIILFQLLISLLFVFLSFFPSVREFFISEKNPFLSVFLIIFIIVTIAVIIVFSCCRDIARSVPINYILLFSFTLCMSFYLLLLCAQYKTSVVITALILTMGATLGLTIYAWKTDRDFTFCGAFLFAMLLALILCFPLFYWMGSVVIHCFFGIMLYSVYIIYDTQLIIGKFGIEYNIDDYCLAALNLYIDIIYLFIKILSILGRRD
jgi:FtsH-binding integral membrane protein